MSFISGEDITFCANLNCADMSCYRNPKHIKLDIPHNFALFNKCEKWNKSGAQWLVEQIDSDEED